MKSIHNHWLGLLFLAASMATTNVYAKGTPYIELQGGSFGLTDDNQVFDDLFNDFTGRISGGYKWDVNHNAKLGLELGYQYYTEQDASYNFSAAPLTLSYSRHAIDLLGVADIHFIEKANIFFKAGAAYVLQDATVSNGTLSASTGKNVFVAKVGTGVGYNITAKANLNLSLNHEFKKDSTSKYAPSASSLMIGINYAFG